MADMLKPADATQMLDAIRWAVSEEAPLELVGRGTKRALGRPFQATHTLDLSALSGIASYEPEELVLTAASGTPLAEIEAALDERRQQLAFEPADWGALLGGGAGGQSLGGVVACNLSGPRRVKAGAARDHFLGFSGVSGRGEAFKAGGRVVKNVTGYDLCKLLAGSHGTLAAMTEVTLKVLPAPERTSTLVLRGLDDEGGVAALCRALGSPHEVSGAAHLPAASAALSGVAEVAGSGRAGDAVTLLRVEGFGPSVEYRCKRLADELGGLAPVSRLDLDASLALWREIRDAALLPGPASRLVWRVSVAPTDGPRLAALLAASGLAADRFYDWGGGLVWLALDQPALDQPADGADGAGGAVIRKAVAGLGGHATLIRAPETLRASVDVFHPQPGPLAALSQRVKLGFDPKRILNPGRMYAGA